MAIIYAKIDSHKIQLRCQLLIFQKFSNSRPYVWCNFSPGVSSTLHSGYFNQNLRRFLATESPLKMIKNAFSFILKAIFILKIFKFLSLLFSHVEKRLD